MIFNVLQGGKPEYRLAESFAYNDDLTAVTFKIRDGVKWSDGQPFTANDVLFTFNMLKAHPELDLNAIWTQIKDVSVDGNNVTIDFNASNSGLIYKLVQVYVVPEHVWKDVADPSTFTNDNKPVGSGPMTEITRFTLESKLPAPELRAEAYQPLMTESQWGAPIRPPDFLVDRVKTGLQPETLAHVINAGVGGTAMPTWTGALQPSQVWGLAYYVRSLALKRGTAEGRALRDQLSAIKQEVTK